MIIKIIVGFALAALAVGFLWFIAKVMYLGLREFFNIGKKNSK